MMTRFLGLGFTLEQVVTMCTENPAKAIGAAQRLGSLAVDRQADISVLDIHEGLGRVRRAGGESAGEPGRRTVLDGQAEVFMPGLGPAALGLGARPGPAGGGWRWGVLLSGEACESGLGSRWSDAPPSLSRLRVLAVDLDPHTNHLALRRMPVCNRQ